MGLSHHWFLTSTLALSPSVVSQPPFLLGLWVSLFGSLSSPPELPLPLGLTHLRDPLSLQSGGEKMLTKSTPVVMATVALIIVRSLVLSVEGGWER